MAIVHIPKHPLAWRIRARFEGKLPPSEYLTRDIRRSNPGWGDETFNRVIKSIEFFLPTGHRLILSGMEAYNFFVEASQSFSRNGAARIDAFWFCGKIPASPTVEMWRIGDGKILRRQLPWGREWGGSPTSGWKAGSVGDRTLSTIMEGH